MPNKHLMMTIITGDSKIHLKKPSPKPQLKEGIVKASLLYTSFWKPSNRINGKISIYTNLGKSKEPQPEVYKHCLWKVSESRASTKKDAESQHSSPVLEHCEKTLKVMGSWEATLRLLYLNQWRLWIYVGYERTGGSSFESQNVMGGRSMKGAHNSTLFFSAPKVQIKRSKTRRKGRTSVGSAANSYKQRWINIKQ